MISPGTFDIYLQDVSQWVASIEADVQNRSNPDAKESIYKEIEVLKQILSEKSFPDEDQQLNVTEQVDRLGEMYANLFSGNDYVPIGEHRLPPLPYEYDALEPAINEEIMKLHHQEHHQSYVDGLNKAEKKMQTARETDDFDLLKHWEKEAAFNGAGHYLHTMFWSNMSPDGGGEPTGKLRSYIDRDFGSFDAFKAHFSEAAKQVQGVGWAILIWSPRSRRLEILQAEFHHLLSQWDAIPLLGLDVWEHAYYLQYKNGRGEYVDNFWTIVNWPNVNERFEQARKLKWEPY
ncbi:superoxide dismutase [Salipaludibacillus neizhouensis]|uniref:superoxide dismutase n=1 Tax=Salipaludibacillus neizhouensis TaxID=885475 RepID=A0A3A9KNM3_9BACI|nr:superoxide dismutase [Salipaludibacillus neizhouensis]RKL66326.1 superoxide dismutase [Salipaludibacillus neizhouensis]